MNNFGNEILIDIKNNKTEDKNFKIPRHLTKLV